MKKGIFSAKAHRVLSKVFCVLMFTMAVACLASCEDDYDDSDVGVVKNGVTWATRNVDEPGTFAASPESAGMFYQWNRKVAYPATGEVTNWDSSTPSGTEWEKANDPCPCGWRVPTYSELSSLVNSGSSWTTQNGVTCLIIGSGSNTVFLPAAGILDDHVGTHILADMMGYYWSSTQLNSANSLGIFFSSYGGGKFDENRTYGLTVRCVKE